MRQTSQNAQVVLRRFVLLDDFPREMNELEIPLNVPTLHHVNLVCMVQAVVDVCLQWREVFFQGTAHCRGSNV